MDASEFSKVAGRLLDSLGGRLPENDREICSSALNAGEWGFMANNLAAALVEDRIPVTSVERDDLNSILSMFSNSDPDPFYRRITHRDETLAALNVVEDQES